MWPELGEDVSCGENRPKMLSRLSGLANTVLQELSGEGEDAEAAALPAGPELDPRQQNGEEVPEDVLERLAHMERLVVQLKDLVREKDAQLQQKEALLQEEKQAAEAKLLKLKLQAKAKLASLNKRIEELTERGGASPTKDPPGEPLPATKVQSDEGACHKWEEEMETLQRRLQEQEEMLAKLQRQLETTTGSLKEAQAQVSSLEKEIQKKGSLLEEQAHQHQAELRQLEARSALEAEMQQNLRLLQRKLEEQEAALLGRTQVVELLQQELNSVEEQKQVLLEQLQEAEAQLDSLSSTSASERQESQSLVERLELDLAEQKLASHRLQEEVQQLSQELTQARTPQADSECQRRVAEERHAQEMAEKNQEIAELQRAEEDLLSSYEAVRAETANAQQDADRPPECSTQDGSPVQQGELSERPKESGCSQAEPEVLTGQAAGQVSTLCEPVAEQDAASPRRTAGQDEQHQSVVEAANETICSKLAMLEKRLEFPAVAAASDQVSCAEIGLEGQSQVALRLSSGTDDSAAGPGDLLDGVGSARIGGLPLADVPAALAQASPCGSPVKPLAPENGPPDVLEYLSAKKHKDLSVLLLELEEAQEEIALLKGQLRDSSSLDPVGDEQPQGESRASDGGKGGEGAVLIQSDSSSSSLVTIEIQELFSPLPGTLLGQDGPCTEGREADQEPPSAPALHPQELAKLHLEIAELQARQQEAEELHQRVLEERAAEIGRLQQLAEGSGKALDTLRAERDQLLSQLKELCCLAELKEQVRQLEGDLADSEKRRLSDHESGISRLALLKEQLQSLKNEAKSKEVKIAALQKDLDESQQRLAEQELCGRRLSSQLQEEEQETRALAGRLKDTSAKAAELSQGLASKELEAARLERLLSERSAEIERLQQQAAEVSASLSDRMVQLSEEKFLLGKEVKSLTERLRLVVQGKQTREQGVGTEEEPPPEQPAERATPPSQEMETLRKENELVRKKLQAALASRKELLSKAHKLERELEAGGGLPGRLGASAWEACQVEAEEKPLESSGINADGAVHPARRGRAASLSQLLPAKEAQQQRILGEKESAVSALQAVVGEMQQSLQEKDLLISSLRAKLEDRCSAPEKQAPPASGQSSGVSGALAPPLAHGASGTTDCDPEGEPRSALEEKACALEQEREQLQKKLQEALASRKETIKKAQQKDRRHREQLKQQQDDYSLLQEQFDQQSREKERMQHQLQALSRTLEENSPLPPEDPALEAAQEPGQEVPAESAAASGSSPAAGDIAAVEQLKADLEKLRAEKGEAEAQVSRLEGELLRKSEAAGQLQEQVRQLLAEMETAKAACSQAETQVVSLRQELEETRAEVARQESLRLHQVDLEEQKEIASKEEIERLNSQLADKSESLRSLQTELEERAGAVKALQGQLEAQNKERTQHLEAEAQQKSAEEAAEHQTRAQVQRKLQAALISRKEVLKESKALKEELASTKAALGSASLRLSDAESRASELEKEKEVLLKKLVDLGEEREKLITEVDKALVENQNVSGSCESLKLALEGMTQEKMKLEEEVDSLRRSQAQELSEWQRKHTELQAEYETLLQSYENISNEAERIQRVVEGVRQEKQELFLKLKGTEAEKKEADARLQGAEQEMEGMREKMRKFAKSKQQKILELEEENERLRTEVPPVDGGLGGTEEMSTCLQEELEDSRKNCESLSSQLKELKAEKDSLNQQIQDLRQMVHSKVEVVGTSSVEEEEVAESEAASSTTLAKAPEATEAQVDLGAGCEPPSASFDAEAKDTGQASSSRGEMDVSLAQLAEQVAELEEKRRVAVEELSRVLRDVETLGEEKRGLEDLLTMKGQEVEALQEKVLAMEQANQQMEGELSGAMRLKGTLEAEKDDLEERLMNQLAELNGSIGNYQQDVADLQSQNQQLQAEVESLQGALSRLEDEKRHLLREKVEVEVEKKKEHVEKLKSTWKGDHGRAQAKELQELLKAKQQEVRQLQKGCIKSQEKASSLERSVKALEFVQSESQKELEAAKRSLAKAEEDTGRAQVELAACRVLLDDTRSEAARALAESLKVQEALRANKAQGKAQLREKERAWERRLEQEADKHAQALREAEERLETLQREQARSEGAVQGLRDSLRQKDQEAKQLQGSLNHTLAQLAAFSRSMSSLQDDRDRVIDQSRQWEKKFSEAIEKMEQEVHAREQACAALEEQAKRTAAQVEELQSRIASLEQSKLAQESSAQKELQRLLGEAELLQEEKRSLAVQLEEAQQLLGDSQKQMQKQETELRGLRERLAGLQDSFSKCQEERDQLGNTVRSREADLRESQFSREQLEADLQASKELTDRLHEETSNKDHQIIGLLAAKEEAVSAAVSELQRRHREERQALEGRISQAEEERTAVEAEKTKALERASQLVGKLKSAREESRRHKAQLDSFTKSMSSLQDDRDRVLEEYQQLERRHLAAILEKDQLIQEAASESNTLKEEIRSLHGQRDDLHAENAKLDAELVRYREDLQQLISIKDCQQKQLLGTQLERIQALEKEKAGVEGRLRESERALEALRLEKQSVGQEAEALAASLSRVQNEMAALQEGGPVLELQAQLQGKMDEVQERSGQLSLTQQRVTELQEELAVLRQSTAQQLQEAETKMKKELKSLHHDSGLMRNETETAEERVAELAKDLLEMEQSLLAVTEENQDLKVQIQSFRKAMSSLQDSWDQCNEELRALEKKYSMDLEEQRRLVQGLREENAQSQEEQKNLAGQRDALASELAALRDSVEEKGLLARLEKLSQQLQAKDVELLRLTAELEGTSSQVTSFSKAMASLQDERDRLLSELDKARRVEEGKLQSAAGTSSASLAEVPSLKKALSSLQSDRDRLLVELKNLQQQYLQVGVDTAEIMRLKAQLQEQKQEVEHRQRLQEQLNQEGASWQLELQKLREEKAAWELEAKGKQLSHVQRAAREERARVRIVEEQQHERQATPEVTNSSKTLQGAVSSQEVDADHLQAQLRTSLKELHLKEMRIQQLNSKLSQVFEEKNSLSLQLRGSSRNLRESHQHYSEVLARCEALEKQMQELQSPVKDAGSLPTDAAPGAPQERSEHPRETYTPDLQELQMKLSEAKQQQSSAKQGLWQLEEQLQEERDRRLAAEEAFSTAQDHIRRLESSEWAHPLETNIDMPPSPEHALLVGPADGSFSKARGATGLRRVLRSLCCSRRRLPLLPTLYLLTVHVLLLLCFTGHL
ncbi:golgin subfamily B member 1 [Rhineura floridana]|uniref:golgin subfamily B member 1 n=1 Tax=Rhineura floridana TaxID=261503 RepID=UPI002AC80BA3|nr:golgin subfamily B member 1 [Rhineura floridana]